MIEIECDGCNSKIMVRKQYDAYYYSYTFNRNIGNDYTCEEVERTICPSCVEDILTLLDSEIDKHDKVHPVDISKSAQILEKEAEDMLRTAKELRDLSEGE